MEQLIKETQTYYDRVRNTYHYVINSRKGPNQSGKNTLNSFEMEIPPFPFPEHQGSQIGILKVNSFYICNTIHYYILLHLLHHHNLRLYVLFHL